MLKILFLTGLLLLLLGFVLDGLNLYWGYTTAKGLSYKSGMILVPAILYALGVAACFRQYEISFQTMLCLAFTFWHICCFSIVPSLLDHLYEKKAG